MSVTYSELVRDLSPVGRESIQHYDSEVFKIFLEMVEAFGETKAKVLLTKMVEEFMNEDLSDD